MTAPTSDRAQRAEKVEKIGQALVAYFTGTRSYVTLAEVLVDTLAPDTERLGGGERESVKDWAFCPECGCRESWTISRGGERECKKCKQTWFPDIDYSDAVSDNLTVANAHREFVLAVENVMEHELNIGVPTKEACVAAIRTLAQTAKDATARAEATEAANMELDKERRSCDQSARDLRAENARLRAQLDAMTGEQKPWAYDVKGWGIFRCKDEQTLEKELQHAAKMTYRTDFQPIPLYRHPSPAARVVGACVVDEHGVVTTEWMTGRLTIAECVEAAERNAYATKRNVYKLATVGPALTPNADGAK